MALPDDLNSRLHKALTTDGSGNPAIRTVAAGFAADSVDDTHIDWGVGANQVSGVDIPLADAGTYFTTDNVEAALQELGAAAGGEVNTASNVGSAGTGIFKQKAIADLELYKLNSVNNILAIALDGTDKVDFTITEANIDHDALTNFASDEHVAHTGVTLTAGTGLTGGGDISTNRSFALSFLGLEALTDPGADRIFFWDDSETASKFLTVGTGLEITDATITTKDSEIAHDSLSGFVAAEHINWSVTGAEDVHDDRIPASAVTQHIGSIDHDSALNFVAAEHVDWAGASAGTVHISNIADASTTAQGVQENATTAEINSGTASYTMCADQFKGSDWGFRYLMLKSVASDTAAETGDGTFGIPIPEEFDTWDVLDVIAYAHTAGATGTTDIQIRRRRSGSDADVLSTKVTMAAQTLCSDGAINGANDDLATGDILYADIDTVETTPPNGLIIVVKVGLT